MVVQTEFTAMVLQTADRQQHHVTHVSQSPSIGAVANALEVPVNSVTPVYKVLNFALICAILERDIGYANAHQ